MNVAMGVRALAAGSLLLAGTVRVPAGEYAPLRTMGGGSRVHVPAFVMDVHAVTRADFLAFVRDHAEWRRDRVTKDLADGAYLADWRGPLDAGDATDLKRPVTFVSWHAAKAYCEAKGARLPSTDEWEYVAAASEAIRDASRDPAFTQRLLQMYSTRIPGEPAPVGHGFTNVYGIEGLHGAVWEWTADFRPMTMQACGGSALGASDTSNYPALLREAYRSALTERSTARLLGFRCAAGAR